MNKRKTIYMPEEMPRLIATQAAKLGRSPDAYVRDIIEERLEED